MKHRHSVVAVICLSFLALSLKPGMEAASASIREETAKEETVKEESVKEEAAKEETVKEETEKEETAKEETAKEETVKEETVKEETAKEETVKEETVKEEKTKEKPAKKETVKEEKTKEENTKKKAADEVMIMISAAGDCTLSSDIKQPAGVNFFSVYQKQKNDSYFFQNVKPIFEQDDLTIVNFEGTLSNRGSRAEKQWAFRGKPSYINILTEGSVEAVAFANNHVRDYGEISYTDTISSFKKAGIVYSSDTQIGIYETKGIKIGMISIQETSRSNAPQVLRKAIKIMKKKKPDLLIVSFHWGIEKTSKLTKSQKDLSRIAIDEGGANLVLGHHPHVLQPIEKYKDTYIVYSLGNFCFGGNTNPPDKDTMIFQQTFTFRNKKLVPDDNLQIIPCSVSSISTKNNYQPTPSTGNEKIRILKKLNSYSRQFGIRFNRYGRLY